jgi:hypothetical protein
VIIDKRQLKSLSLPLKVLRRDILLAVGGEYDVEEAGLHQLVHDLDAVPEIHIKKLIFLTHVPRHHLAYLPQKLATISSPNTSPSPR